MIEFAPGMNDSIQQASTFFLLRRRLLSCRRGASAFPQTQDAARLRQKSVLVAKAREMEGALGRLAGNVVGVDAHLHRVGHQPDGAKAGFHHFLLGAADHAGKFVFASFCKGPSR